MYNMYYFFHFYYPSFRGIGCFPGLGDRLFSGLADRANDPPSELTRGAVGFPPWTCRNLRV